MYFIYKKNAIEAILKKPTSVRHFVFLSSSSETETENEKKFSSRRVKSEMKTKKKFLLIAATLFGILHNFEENIRIPLRMFYKMLYRFNSLLGENFIMHELKKEN